MSKPKIITATEASRNFADFLNKVAYGGESFVIKKGQRVMARICPVEPEPKVKNTELQALLDTTSEIKAGDQVTVDEAEYYQSILEQIRKAQVEEVVD